MTEKPDRPRVVSRTKPREPETRTSQEIRDRRSQNMIAIGVVALVISLISLANWAPVGLLFALLGVGLLVGGLVIRP